MSLLDKMKNLFTEEVDEEPIKSEVIQVEIPAPEIKANEDLADTQPIKVDEKVPVFFNDEDFKELEKPKVEVKSSYIKEIPKKVERKIFQPTPIISPVYGVLDKNYYKEDITDKTKIPSIYDTKPLNLDEVRKKAYGTLEDDLESTLFGSNSILFNQKAEEDIPEENILFDELTEVIDLNESKFDEEKVMETEELFDLIDSMYEKGE